jgi:HlyD family secretion protein
MTDVDLNDLKIQHQPVAKRNRFPFLALLLVFSVGAVIGFYANRYGPLKQAIEESGTAQAEVEETPDIASPSAPPPPDSFTEGGWVEVPSYHPIVVSSLVPGRIEELKVLEGSRVAKGDVVALLYRRDHEDAVKSAAAEVAAAAAELARLKAGFRVQEVERARADLEAAEADVDLRERVLARTRGLLGSGAVSAEDLDRDEAAFRGAAALRDAKAQDFALKEEGSRVEEIDAAEAEHSRRLVQLELARNQLEYTTVKSPAAGVVLERFVTPGTSLPASHLRLVSLYDPGDLQVRVDVRQENITSVFVGQEVEVTSDVEPERIYNGTVIRIDPMADFKKNTVQVKVKLHNPSELLYPEMIARIRFLRKNDDKPDGQG